MNSAYSTYLGSLLVMALLAYPMIRVIAFATKVIT